MNAALGSGASSGTARMWCTSGYSIIFSAKWCISGYGCFLDAN